MKKIIATLGVAVLLSLGGAGFAHADEPTTGDTSSTNTTADSNSTSAPAPAESSDPTPTDQPTAPEQDSASSSPTPPVSTEISEPTPFTTYEVSHDWYAPRPATVADPFAVPQHSAVLTCEAIKQHDVYTITSAAMAADYAALLATDNLTGPADDAEFSPHNYTVTDIAALCPVPAQVCAAAGPVSHESDDNAGVLTDAGVEIYSQGDGKATDWIYATSSNAQGVTTLDWTADEVVGNGIFARFIFDLSADGGPAYASFSGLPTHVDQTTVAGYGSKAVFSGLTLADVGTTWPHNVLKALSFQTGSSYPAKEGGRLTSISGACLTASFITTHTTTTTTTPTADLPNVLAFTGPGPITALLVIVGGMVAGGGVFLFRKRWTIQEAVAGTARNLFAKLRK